MENKVQYGVQKQQLNRLSKDEYLALRELTHLNKNMYNVALYNIRQHYFATGKYLNYNKNYPLCKDNENYKLLNKNSAQQTMKKLEHDFSSFFALLKLKKEGKYQEKVKMPGYLEKDSHFTLYFAEFNAKNNIFTVPMSREFKNKHGSINIKVPVNLENEVIKEVRIKPKYNARFFEIQWVYELPVVQKESKNKNVLAIDLGLDNLMTCVTNSGDAFIIDGKDLKSKNQWANKENSRLQSIKDLQKNRVETTKNQAMLWNKRNNQVNDYLNKAVFNVVKYCKKNEIDTIVLGYTKDIQRNINIGRVNNQNFVNIPIGKIKEKLEYSCIRNGMSLILQEESYTSKADFLAGDFIPVYERHSNVNYIFSGKRIKRGLYKSSTGVLLNADVNGALNILKKANVCDISLKNNDYLSPKRTLIIKSKCNSKAKRQLSLGRLDSAS